MDTKLAVVKNLLKILEQNKNYDEVINSCAEKVDNMSELINIVAGTVKSKLTLDYFIQNISSRPMKKLSPPVKNILRAAIYELEYIKTADYAVINSYVEISKSYDKNSSNFINAVLRNYLRKKDQIKFPKPEDNHVESISTEFSHPAWLVERWIKTYGIEQTIKICEFNNKAPVISIRINTLKTSKQNLLDLFKENNVEFIESPISDECLILKNQGNIKKIAGFKEGYWHVLGESSSLVTKILNPQQGERILDLCAAPGGKTVHIADSIKNSGEIVAVDISKNRIKKITENCERLGIDCVKTVVSDAISYSDDLNFDKILIDAPCSNTGVLGKRPDARWNRTPEDIKNLNEIQNKILQNASTLLKSGGILVYSTCSIEPEENQFMIEKFLENNKNFVVAEISDLACLKEKNCGYIQILQSKHDIDGFFIAKFRKI